MSNGRHTEESNPGRNLGEHMKNINGSNTVNTNNTAITEEVSMNKVQEILSRPVNRQQLQQAEAELKKAQLVWEAILKKDEFSEPKAYTVSYSDEGKHGSVDMWGRAVPKMTRPITSMNAEVEEKRGRVNYSSLESGVFEQVFFKFQAEIPYGGIAELGIRNSNFEEGLNPGQIHYINDDGIDCGLIHEGEQGKCEAREAAYVRMNNDAWLAIVVPIDALLREAKAKVLSETNPDKIQKIIDGIVPQAIEVAKSAPGFTRFSKEFWRNLKAVLYKAREKSEWRKNQAEGLLTAFEDVLKLAHLDASKITPKMAQTALSHARRADNEDRFDYATYKTILDIAKKQAA